MQILVLQNPIIRTIYDYMITTLRLDLNVAHWISQDDAVSDKLRILHQPMQLRTAASTKISKHAYLVDIISLCIRNIYIHICSIQSKYILWIQGKTESYTYLFDTSQCVLKDTYFHFICTFQYVLLPDILINEKKKRFL